MAKEAQFQANLIKEIKERFPGSVVLKNDPLYIQGFPDLTVLYGDTWFVLECKAYQGAPQQPNQEFYIDRLSIMSHAYFISPENKDEILDEIQQSLRA